MKGGANAEGNVERNRDALPPKGIRFVLITGLSGAGKTEAIRCFEDMGFFCVDNLPPTLIPKFAELCAQSGGSVNKIALVCDVRGGGFFDSLIEALAELERIGFHYSVLFLEASDEALVRRFKETRRRHPLAHDHGVLEGIKEERRRLDQIRGRADVIIDTSNLSPKALKERISQSFLHAEGIDRISVSLVSFGFKHGLPMDADLVFDARFLPNPHYVESLQAYTGNDTEVVDYVFRWPISHRFMEKICDLLDFLLPLFIKEGKAHLVIGVGCTGGKHRSVAVSNRLAEFLRSKAYHVSVEHRDVAAD
ncbi:MAG: RNase adapter RapZ [Firmicutes bacterium]|nr:RNase adapter RapZ [Bacillota bacterium]